MDDVVDNMYNAAYKVVIEKTPFEIMGIGTQSRLALKQCFPKELHLRTVGLVASATLQVRWLPASVEIVVICAVAAITDGGAVSVLAIDVVITALG